MIILAPTDFSDNSNNAIEYAAEMAQSTPISKMIILHVLSEESKEEDRESAAQKLQAILSATRETYPAINCTTQIERGDVVKVITKTAAEQKAGLIVMETEGATNFTRLFVGSKTAQVIEDTKCPVLSLPPNYEFRKPKQMIFCTNFSRDDIKDAVDFIMIAKMFDANVIVAHIKVASETMEVDKSLVQLFTREVRLLTDYDKITFRVEDDNTVTMGIDQLIHDTDADLIALSTRKRNMLEKFFNPSITRKLSLHSHIPLLAFHQPEE